MPVYIYIRNKPFRFYRFESGLNQETLEFVVSRFFLEMQIAIFPSSWEDDIFKVTLDLYDDELPPNFRALMQLFELYVTLHPETR